jgi:hypothetical protein
MYVEFAVQLQAQQLDIDVALLGLPDGVKEQTALQRREWIDMLYLTTSGRGWGHASGPRRPCGLVRRFRHGTSLLSADLLDEFIDALLVKLGLWEVGGGVSAGGGVLAVGDDVA